MTGHVVLNLAYGIEAQPENDPLIMLSEQGISASNKVTRPGYYLVDSIPWLQKLPKWFPCLSFRRDAEHFREAILTMRDVPFKHAKQALVSVDYCL
jgi:hypothetical protein